jgi:hypothetical protein
MKKEIEMERYNPLQYAYSRYSCDSADLIGIHVYFIRCLSVIASEKLLFQG